MYFKYIYFWVAFLWLVAALAVGHEFWIEPRAYFVKAGEEIHADLKNGEFFKGSVYPYLKNAFSRFEVVNASDIYEISGRAGNRPAVQFTAQNDGLHIVAYSSTVNTVEYNDFSQSKKFVKGKDLGWVIDQYRARG